ncbi:DUF4328 domain-containing protein [Streptomyces decoyicus]|uniref:DUF4328 domain-containing protein n=1 Tax=Streptomyces decoyicus TaxID=249567 RepID=UPI00066225DC|nr:DUF4328 domain-containing protein [Streptomyces decoyicus]QZY18747.1 DUF4328 domain-containing protein [Streptomyces decoyicus]
MSSGSAGLPADISAGGSAVRSPKGLANAVTVLLALVIAVDVFAVYAGLNIRALLDNLQSTPRHELAQGDDLYGLAGTLQLVCTLATAPVFIVWFYRVRVNAEGFARDVCTMNRAWAVGAWFVPIGNLWLPYRFAKEVWDASAQATADGAWREVSRRRVSAWWTTWIAALVVSRAGAALYRNPETPHALQQATSVVMLSDLLDIAAAVLGILFVRKLSRMQQVSPGS